MPYRTVGPGLILLALLVAGSSARAQQVALHGAVTRFTAAQLGGIRAITRTEAVRPDRREIDYQLLADPADATSEGAPQQIQVLGPHGAPHLLADIDGSDCTFQRFVVVRSGSHVALITADRRDDATATSLTSPAPVDIQLYRPQQGGEPGESSPIFIADSAVHHVGPLCNAADMSREIGRVAATAFTAEGRTP